MTSAYFRRLPTVVIALMTVVLLSRCTTAPKATSNAARSEASRESRSSVEDLRREGVGIVGEDTSPITPQIMGSTPEFAFGAGQVTVDAMLFDDDFDASVAVDLPAAFEVRQKQLLESRNQQLQIELESINRAGGLIAYGNWERQHLKRLLSGRSEQDRSDIGRKATPRVAWIDNILATELCPNPEIIGLDSNEVTPGSNVFIYGCKFGVQPGEVRLVLTSPMGEHPLELLKKLVSQGGGIYWQEDMIIARVPDLEGLLPQPAEVVVRMPNGVELRTPVSFVPTYSSTYLNPVAHPSVYGLQARRLTDNDQFGSIGVMPDKVAWAVFGRHVQSCCLPQTGTDVWTFYLKNGWTVTKFVKYRLPGSFSAPDNVNQGGAGCLYGVQPGRVDDVRLLPTSTNPGGTAELHVTWWCDWFASGVEYGYNIFIVGPKGLPYW